MKETDLEYSIIVHLFQGEGEALSENSVHPALHDGRHTEPVQWKLRGETQSDVLLFKCIVLSPPNFILSSLIL